MIDFHNIELDILYHRNPDPDYVNRVVNELMAYKIKIDYYCDRFIEQYGSKIDSNDGTNKYTKFMKIQSEEYSKITRLMRVIDAYSKK